MDEQSFKELLHEFADKIVDECDNQRLSQQLGVDYEQSPDVNEVANQLLLAFKTRLAVQHQ